ncbi:MAG: RsmD family RNA methyltransferase [Spirochaetales bacterium]|nr:RsmD family RNA methyltransferase [Spirochaetales bacterium]
MQKGGTKRNPRNNNIKKLSIRVASGTLRGRKLDCPPGEIRPMTSMCKQALFNIMFGRKDMEMLDLFSGSASISIEGYSRGMVKSADVVEGDYGKRAILNGNIDKLGLTGKIKPIISDAFTYIRRCTKKYDFIMLDPPFKMENKQSLLELLELKELLKDNGIIVIHAKYTDSFDNQIGKLVQTDYRRYGINVLVFYQWEKNIIEDNMGVNENE